MRAKARKLTRVCGVCLHRWFVALRPSPLPSPSAVSRTAPSFSPPGLRPTSVMASPLGGRPKLAGFGSVLQILS
jgi:hypothetical protein